MFGYKIGSKEKDLSIDTRNNAAFAPLCAVLDTAFTWGDDLFPRTPWHKTVIYEAHVKGMTALNKEIPEELRGTYAALGSEPVVRHLKRLGVTALELMPVHYRVDNQNLVAAGLNNYWGYNTLGFFAPDLRYSHYKGPTDVVREF